MPVRMTREAIGAIDCPAMAQSSAGGSFLNAEKMQLEPARGLGKDAAVQPQPHRSGRKWRRFLRHNRQFVFILFFLVIILALVAGLFWLITSPDFVKPR